MTEKKLSAKIVRIAHKKIRPSPYQTRKAFPLPELKLLAQSIRENGVLQPLIVRPASNGCYELIAGERRLRAARMAGLDELPCVIRQADDHTAAAWCLLENMQRRTLDFNEEAEGLRRFLSRSNQPMGESARQLGISERAVEEMLEILRLPEDIRKKLAEAGCSARHARVLLQLSNMDLMRRTARVICEKHLSAEDSERLVGRVLTPPKSIPVTLFKDVQIFVTTIERAVETMRVSGIQPQYSKHEDDDFAEFLIRIPKRARHGIRIASGQ
jgi:ParB family chromosome partitioning protein